MYLCIMSVPGASRGQRRMSDAVELELGLDGCELPCGCWKQKTMSSARATGALQG